MPAKRDRLQHASPFRRVFRNSAWLLGGKGFGAVCGLVCTVVLAHALGLKEFGHFSLIMGAAQVLIGVAGLQTWRVMLRHGRQYAQAGDWDRFGRLGMLCGLLDAVGAMVGCLFAAVLIYGFAPLLDLAPDFRNAAFWFCCASLWALVSAPMGIARAVRRHDVIVYVGAVVPTGRLITTLAIWLLGPSVGRFLFAWAAIDILEAALCWYLARRICPQAVRLSNLRQWRRAFVENADLARFLTASCANATIDAAIKSGPLLVVGCWAGTRAAGLYRLGSHLSRVPGKFSGLFFGPARAAADVSEFRRMALRTGAAAGAVGLIGVFLAVVAGRPLLVMAGGQSFAGAVSVLVPLSIAASLDLAGAAFEPLLHAHARTHLPLIARLVTVVALVAGLMLLMHMRLAGGAWAVALASAVSCVTRGIMAWQTLQKAESAQIGLLASEPRSTDG